jgi:hypothetical protein
MVESTLQKKVEISEEQKAKNLSIKEQFIAEFNKKNVDLFPKNYTISTETIRGDYESNKITTIGF